MLRGPRDQAGLDRGATADVIAGLVCGICAADRVSDGNWLGAACENPIGPVGGQPVYVDPCAPLILTRRASARVGWQRLSWRQVGSD